MRVERGEEERGEGKVLFDEKIAPTVQQEMNINSVLHDSDGNSADFNGCSHRVHNVLLLRFCSFLHRTC